MSFLVTRWRPTQAASCRVCSCCRELYNNACLLVFSMLFSTKYWLDLCNTRHRAIAVIRQCDLEIVFFSGWGHRIRHEMTVEIVVLNPKPTRGLGRVVSFPGGVWDGAQPKTSLDVLYAILCDFRRVLVQNIQISWVTVTHFYRAMHFSANARSWDRMSSVCLSVCDVGDLWSHRLEILETNCTDN